MEMIFEVTKNAQLGDLLRKEWGISKRTISRLKRTPMGITVNGKHMRTIDSVTVGDRVRIHLVDEKLLLPNSCLSVETAFENENVIIFNKPANMPVHPSLKHYRDTLGNYFAYKFPHLTFRPVNRLDRDTSGLCAVAKNAVAAAALQGTIKKTYYAVVTGSPHNSGTINAPIARERDSVIKRVVREDGKKAVTHYEITACGEKYSLARVELETGRTHQIRVHFAYIGHPLAGDDLYGGSREDIDRQALHCGELSFKEPVSGEILKIQSELPRDMGKLLVSER